jgi:quercetin 2,3-dioxygenase
MAIVTGTSIVERDTQNRRIKKTWKSQPFREGAGVRLKRAFGFNETPQLDPFLLLDAFHSENPEDYKRGFPWHPHRGIETITYILDGDVEHGDSLGNRGLISAGDVQWMTAGSGIIHQEMPKGNRKGEMWGFQLWSNLPAGQKMMNPRYREVKQGEIPQVKTADGASVRVIAGEVAGVRGPVRDIVTDPQFLDVSLPAGKSFTHPVEHDHTVFAYVAEGEGYFDARDTFARETPSAHGEGTIVLYGPGNRVTVSADKKAVRFLLIAGRPLDEPIAWHGPIVMNTQRELETAFKEFQEGTFVKRA